MTDLGPATEADIEPICEFLAAHMGRGMSAEQYRPLFTYPWLERKPNLGFLLTDGGRIVGFLGTVYADRIIRDRPERLCNLSSWCVLPEYRNHSLTLLYAVCRGADQTVTCLSPTPAVQKVLTALRFERLDTYKLFTVPLAQPAGLLRFPRPRLSLAPEDIARRLNPSHGDLLRDHAGTGCGHLLLEAGDRYCYVIWKRRVKFSVAFSEILYVSDQDLLLRHFELAKLRMLWRDRTLLLAVDKRLLGRRPPVAFPYRRVTLFKSARLKRADLDNLYSELALL
jgi:hypothetical protein